MNTPIPPKFCSALAAFELIGRRVYGDDWTGKEIKARRLPGPETVRKAKEIVAQDSLNFGELSSVVGFTVTPEAVQEWVDPANPDYEIERAAYDRAKKVRTTLRSILRSGVTSWILTKNGKTIEIPTIWFEQRGRIYLYILFDPDALRMTHSCPDEASMSQGQGGPLEVSGQLYLDRAQLLAAIDETPRRSVGTATTAIRTKPGRSSRPKGRRGRKPYYDAPAFMEELERIAKDELRPETQSELERRMLEWCQMEWGEEPATSWVRQRVSPIYNSDRWGGNF
jgi:hypothetical protein